MARPIKFRAWDVAKKEMIYFGAFQFEQFPNHPLAPPDVRERIYPFEGIESGEMVTYDPLNGWFLMQFTGKKDMTEKEIYEGDVLLSKRTGIKYPVVFNSHTASFTAENKMLSLSADEFSEAEIIGNIYETINTTTP